MCVLNQRNRRCSCQIGRCARAIHKPECMTGDWAEHSGRHNQHGGRNHCETTQQSTEHVAQLATLLVVKHVRGGKVCCESVGRVLRGNVVMRRVLCLVHQTYILSQQHHQGDHHPYKGVTQAAPRSCMAGLRHVHMVTQAHGYISKNPCCLLGRWLLLEALARTRSNTLPCTHVVRPALS